MVMFISGIRPDAALRTADEIQKKLSEKSIEHKYSDISDKLTVSMGIYNTEYAGQDISSRLILIVFPFIFFFSLFYGFR